MKIQSSELVKYNANTRGTATGDCTARAISLAFNIGYLDARKRLNESAKTRYDWDYNSHSNVVKVIREMGGGNISNCSRQTVNSFADQNNTGTYILWCSKDGISNTGNHLVTIIDGTVYDSWDSRSYYVKGYWTISSGIHGSDVVNIQPIIKDMLISSKNIEWYSDYAGKLFDKIISNNKKIKQLKSTCDFDIEADLTVDKVSLYDYTFRMFYTVNVIYRGVDIPSQTFNSKVVVVFNPTMKEENLQEYFDKTFYNKFYSYLYDLIVKIADTCEGYRLTEGNSNSYKLTFWSESERKSFKSLPYWAQRLASYFRFDNNPQYDRAYDSISLTIKTPPFDTEYGNYSQRDFSAYYMNELRDGLDYYKRTGDYEKAYQIAQGG